MIARSKRLVGRRALITGASQGLGLEVARAYVSHGAHVVVCARSADRLAIAAEELSRQAGGHSEVIAHVADVARPEDVETLVKTTVERLGGLDVLVANAGIYGPMGPTETVPWDEWRQAVEVNLNGVVLSSRAVVPLFKQQLSGKIIVLSGGGATRPMPFLSAYAATKAAVVRFVETLALELAGFGIDCNSIAPGALNTRLLDEVLAAGPDRVGQAFFDASMKQKQTGGDSPERAAELCVFLGSSDSDGITARLLSAKWDPWSELPRHRDELTGSDLYTLRRIVPADRGKDWGG
jgi:NAD(P)-dependent dehydrogenase (short-subunit alcohol dehydrogenase family)